MVKGTERRTERFTIRLASGLRDAIERAAATERRSPSDWIVLALEKAAGYTPPLDLAKTLGIRTKRKRAT